MDKAVASFRDLLAPVPGVSPGEVQRRAAALLPDLVRHSALSWHTPGTPVPRSGGRLLLGVAVWSGYDLRLLDVLNDEISAGRGNGLTVDVFDAGSLTSMEAFERFIPGLGDVHQMPVVGYWEDGNLREKATGFFARKLIARLFGLDPQRVQPPPVEPPVS